MDRMRVWLAVSPIIAAGVLLGHVLGYRLSGAPTDRFHDYLGHAPQVLLVLAVLAPALALSARGAPTAGAWPFPAAAVATFVVQEHVERIAHSGDVPWLLTSPSFVLGVALQVPIALVVWLLARRLLRALEAPSSHRPRVPRLQLDVPLPVPFDVRTLPSSPFPGRGPPLLGHP